MSEEPSLPPLPAVSWDEQSQSFSNNPLKRGRDNSHHASSLDVNSSDPAIFSSDDDPALDNYIQGRRKKRYIGSWFQQHPTTEVDSMLGNCATPPAPRGKRPWTRQDDSGVFLGSDISDDITEDLDTTPRPRLSRLYRMPRAQLSTLELQARFKIQSCMEQGKESIDFISAGLEHLSNETILPLTQFSCIPLVAKDVAFEQKDPELKLYLAMNRLTRVPGTVFDITHLAILSLRGNNLKELPPGISKLHNLQQLNVSQNELRHLPVELVDLFAAKNKLNDLIIHPNPFIQPGGAFLTQLLDEEANPSVIQAVSDSYQLTSLKLPLILTRALGRSPLQLGNTSGKIVSDFKLPLDPAAVAPIMNYPDPTVEFPKGFPDTGRVPSLLEAVLRTCQDSSQLYEMRECVPDSHASIQQLLDRAIQQQEVGGLSCSRCKKSIVVPTVEWIEWRELRRCKPVDLSIIGIGVSSHVQPKLWMELMSKAEGERAVPFLHRGCSWRCGPKGRGTSWYVPDGCELPKEVFRG